MASDLATFTLAFAFVWAGLAAYFLWLHCVEARLARELAELRRRLDSTGRRLK